MLDAATTAGTTTAAHRILAAKCAAAATFAGQRVGAVACIAMEGGEPTFWRKGERFPVRISAADYAKKEG